MLMAETRPLVAAGFIIFRKFNNIRQYLLLQTSYGENHWTPPKGHLDEGENEKQAAIRETEEEAGLSLNDYEIIDDFKKELNYDVKGHQKHVVYWLAKLKSESFDKIRLSNEHINYKWLQLQETLEYAKHEDMQQIFKSADVFLNNFNDIY